MLAFGPYRVIGADTESDRILMPAYILQQLPVFRVTTNHWRWTLPAVLCLAITVSIGLSHLSSMLQRYGIKPWVSPVLLSAIYLIEMVTVFPLPASKPIWPTRPAPIAQELYRRSDIQVIFDRTPRRKWHQVTHGKRIVGGWLPRLDREVYAVSHDLENSIYRTQTADETHQRLGSLGIDAMILDGHRAVIVTRDPDHANRFAGELLVVESPSSGNEENAHEGISQHDDE